jgi:hypothetical protein
VFGAGSPTRIRRHAGHAHHADHDHHHDVHHEQAGPEVGLAGGAISAGLAGRITSASGGATLPPRTLARMEHGFGASFAGVRIHANSELPRQIAADAFTAGTHVHFAPGLYDPSSTTGERLLAHELTHVVQQGGAGVARHVCDSACDHDGAVARSVERSHELVHEHGHGTAVARVHDADPDHVQRHSSFEHLMLGNVKPEDLATVGAWQDAIEQTKPTRTGLGKKLRGSGGGQDEAQVDVTLGGQQVSIKKVNILHVLLQEMRRLKEWQKNPPKESSVDQGNKVGASLAPVGKDPTFDVVTVMLPQGLLCTYGEMNTLGDYYGSVDVLRGAGAKQVEQLLQSVREETWGFLTTTYDKVVDSLTATELQDPGMKNIRDTVMDEFILPELYGDSTTFAGATAFTISGKLGQAELLTGVQGTGAKGDTNKYGTSLGRNACHFVPESWNAWATNHKEARRLANDAFQEYLRSEQLKQQIATAPDQAQAQRDFEASKAESSRLGNEALMVNGFGDHFLQDSYASGHMINKTQIMQFYIEYIDANNQWDYFKDANWRKVQNIAYTQNLAPLQQYDQTRVEGYAGATGPNANKGIDPQSVENRSDGTWQTNFTELGLQVPRSLSNPANSATREVLRKLRGQARGGKDALKGTEIVALMQPLGFDAMEIRMAVADMVLDGVLLTDVDVATRGRQMAAMRDKRAAADAKGAAAKQTEGAGEELELKAFRSGKFRLRPELKPKKGSAPTNKTEAEYQEEYAAITYNDYLEFIQSSFLQKSTNALHDTFCKGGLTVYDNAGTLIGKVYGDDSMFNAQSSMGVAHSGTTSQMSRDAILNILNVGNDGGISVQSIVDRFPTQVRADVYDSKGKVKQAGVGPMPIEAWHNDKNRGGLQGEANKWIFKSMDWSLLQKAGPGAMKDLGTFFSAPPPHVPF